MALCPLILLAWINVSSFISRTLLLAILAYFVQLIKEIAIIALIILPPRSPATAIAKTRPGKARNTSTILIISLSIFPPIYPLIIPTVVPNKKVIKTTIIAENIVLFAPYKTLENTHLPRESVPNKNSLLGDCSVFVKSTA